MSGPLPSAVADLLLPQARRETLETLRGARAGEVVAAMIAALVHLEEYPGSEALRTAAGRLVAYGEEYPGAPIPPALIDELGEAWAEWVGVMAVLADGERTLGWIDERKQHRDASRHGRKGGRATKRQAWADLVAQKLKRRAGPDRSEAEAWALLPSEPWVWEVGPDGASHTVYRKGDTLRADPGLSSSAAPRELARSSFLKRYLRPVRKTRGH